MIPRFARSLGCSAAASGPLAAGDGKVQGAGARPGDRPGCRPIRFWRLGTQLISRGRPYGKRPLALDETARDIIGDSSDDRVGRLAFGHQHAALARILKKSIGALVVRHVDKRDHVDEKARMLALRQRHIEQVDALRGLVDDRLERALERFETGNFELAHLGHRLGALGVLNPSLPDRG